MVIALNLYGSNVAASVSTNSKLASVIGGTGSTNTILIGTSTGYGEIWSQGNAGAWAAGVSISAPTDHGWMWDVTTLEGLQLAAGVWTVGMKFAVSIGSIQADAYFRSWKRSSGGVFTHIGDNIATSLNITTTQTVHTPSASLPLMNFSTGDKYYHDFMLHITSNSTGSGTATLINSIASTGATGSPNHEELDTPGYQAIPSAILQLVGNHRAIGRVR